MPDQQMYRFDNSACEHYRREAERIAADFRLQSKLACEDEGGGVIEICSWCDVLVDRNGDGKHKQKCPTNVRPFKKKAPKPEGPGADSQKG